MADLSSLLKRTGKGAAAESTLTYFGEMLDRLYRDACVALETAQGEEALHEARADFKAVRRLTKRLGFDIKDGLAAQKEMDQARG